MANDLNSLDYGFRPTGMGGAAMQANEELYLRDARAKQQQMAEAEFQRKADHDLALADYYKAQTAQARDSLLARQEAAQENAVLKRAQAEVLRKQQARPVVDQILQLTEKGKQGDMQSVIQAARMHKMLEEQFPDYAKLIPQQNKFQDVDPVTKKVRQSVMSGYDPETFAAGAQNWPRDPGYVKTEVANTNANSRENVAKTAADASKYSADRRAEAQQLVLALREKMGDKAQAGKLEAQVTQLWQQVQQGVPGAQEQLDSLLNTSANFWQSKATAPKLDLGLPTTSPSKQGQEARGKAGSQDNPIKLK